MCRCHNLHARQRFHPTLSLTRFGRFGTETFDELGKTLLLTQLTLMNHLLLSQSLGSNTFKSRIVTTIESDFLLLDVGNVFNGVIEEIPIVGDE